MAQSLQIVLCAGPLWKENWHYASLKCAKQNPEYKIAIWERLCDVTDLLERSEVWYVEPHERISYVVV